VVLALKEAYPDEPLEFLVAEKNIGNSTYDGIEVGAERVTQEIEDYIKKLKDEGKKVDKLSITGYSLGGLVGRYVVGLLYTRGVFDEVKPYVSYPALLHYRLLMYAELHNLCDAASWSKSTTCWLGERHLEQYWWQDSIHHWITALHSR